MFHEIYITETISIKKDGLRELILSIVSEWDKSHLVVKKSKIKILT